MAAPSSPAWAMVSWLAMEEVIKTMGARSPSIRCMMLRPSSPGSTRSRTRMSGLVFSIRDRTSLPSPVEAVTSNRPVCSRASRSILQASVSASANMILILLSIRVDPFKSLHVDMNRGPSVSLDEKSKLRCALLTNYHKQTENTSRNV